MLFPGHMTCDGLYRVHGAMVEFTCTKIRIAGAVFFDSTTHSQESLEHGSWSSWKNVVIPICLLRLFAAPDRRMFVVRHGCSERPSCAAQSWGEHDARLAVGLEHRPDVRRRVGSYRRSRASKIGVPAGLHSSKSCYACVPRMRLDQLRWKMRWIERFDLGHDPARGSRVCREDAGSKRRAGGDHLGGQRRGGGRGEAPAGKTKQRSRTEEARQQQQ